MTDRSFIQHCVECRIISFKDPLSTKLARWRPRCPIAKGNLNASAIGENLNDGLIVNSARRLSGIHTLTRWLDRIEMAGGVSVKPLKLPALRNYL
jgi:hypothetical protein